MIDRIIDFSVVAARGRHLVQLVDNFRSRADILRAVETVTAGTPGIEDRSLVAGRKFDDAPDYSVEAIAAPDLTIEAQCVARRILDFPDFAFHDFAVLVRNTEVIPEFTAAFDAAGIPYVVNRGRGFYDSREVNDLTHLLRVIANPRDEISLAVVLRSPLVNASEEAMLRLKMNGETLSDMLSRTSPAAFGARDHARLARFAARLREWRHRREDVTSARPPLPHPRLARCAARLREWRQRREYVTFDRLLLSAIDDCGYPSSPNLDKFLAQARAAAARMPLDEYVAELALVRQENPREPDAPPEDSANAVQIMTVHSAKGLEFPVVFVAAIHKGVDTSVPVVAFSRHHGLGARWRNPASGREANGAKDDLFQHALRHEWSRREEQESSRLLYVAMTRAERHLVLSFSATGRKPANWDKLVIERLALDPSAPRDEVVEYQTPDGQPWKARVRIVQAVPEEAAAELPARPRAPREESAVLEVSLPVAAEQQDSNATVTDLSLFASCPRKYYRSEEHTSELQSLRHLVCRLLLEKK